MKRKLLLPALLVLLWAASPAICSAQVVYQITETELTQLEATLNRQENIISQLLTEASLLKSSESKSKEQLLIALEELQKMKQELMLLRLDLENSQNSLKKANQSLQEYEKEMKAKTRTLKMQRNIWFVGFIGTSVALLGK